ncbi:hypothetical protein pb186bvf_003306 [Paramecium bursaria]
MFKLFILILISSAIARHHHIVGGKSQADPSDQGVSIAVSYAKSNFASYCQLPGYQWKQTLGVQSQIVAGSKYYISAQVQKDQSTETIEVQVWLQPLQNDGTQKISIVGSVAIKISDVGSPSGKRQSDLQSEVSYQRVLGLAIDNFSQYCNLPGYQWVGVESVEGQLVAGRNYHIYAKVQNQNQVRKIHIVIHLPTDNSVAKFQSCSQKA